MIISSKPQKVFNKRVLSYWNLNLFSVVCQHVVKCRCYEINNIHVHDFNDTTRSHLAGNWVTCNLTCESINLRKPHCYNQCGAYCVEMQGVSIRINILGTRRSQSQNTSEGSIRQQSNCTRFLCYCVACESSFSWVNIDSTVSRFLFWWFFSYLLMQSLFTLLLK